MYKVMDETLHYIDSYFQNGLSETEKGRFEERCQQDEAFAGAVAFYVMSREAARQELLEQKAKAWTDSDEAANANVKPAPVRTIFWRRWAAAAAAACVALATGAYYLLFSVSTQRLAHHYIQDSLSHIGHTMDGSTDSLQQGITDYNSGNYTEAAAVFTALYKSHPDNNEALENAGIAYLRQKAYDQALAQFTELSNKKLVSNRGLFLKAVTLLDRNAAGDKEAAKPLLEKVRDEKLDGNQQAADWLDKMVAPKTHRQ